MKINNFIFSFYLAGISAFLLGCNISIDKVEINERKILVNETPYFIKGICYNPVPRNSYKRNFSSLDLDLALMNEVGINTIRVYSPIEEKSVLDKIEKAGVKVIINFGYDQQGYYDLKTKSYIDYVKKYKDHNAILLWELGNEYNFHPEWFGGDIKKIRAKSFIPHSA